MIEYSIQLYHNPLNEGIHVTMKNAVYNYITTIHYTCYFKNDTMIEYSIQTCHITFHSYGRILANLTTASSIFSSLAVEYEALTYALFPPLGINSHPGTKITFSLTAFSRTHCCVSSTPFNRIHRNMPAFGTCHVAFLERCLWHNVRRWLRLDS